MAKFIDDVRCPRCGAATLVTLPGECDGARYRYCSYVSCTWGLDDNVFYDATSVADRWGHTSSLTDDGASGGGPHG